MENGLLYILAFSAMAIALFACILPQAQLYSEITGIPTLTKFGLNPPNATDKIIYVTTGAGWSTTKNGTANMGSYPFALDLYTGTTAGSQVTGRCLAYELNSGDITFTLLDHSKNLTLSFVVDRHGDYAADHVSYIQIKSGYTFGDLTGVGFGVKTINYTIYGEGYGSGGRGTVELGTYTKNYAKRFSIVLIPHERLDFYLNGDLAGSLSSDYVPNSDIVTPYLSVSAFNAGTASEIAHTISQITIIQSW